MTTITGTQGFDSLVGTTGTDTIRGLGGNDILAGSAGSDLLYGMAGNDELWGNEGADKFIFRLDGSLDLLADFSTVEGDHMALFAADDATLIGGAGGMLIWNQQTDLISWDPDSGGTAAATAFAASAAEPVLTRESFAAGFEPAAIRVIGDNGVLLQDTVFDWGDAAFDTARSVHVAGELASYDITYDSGAESITRFDYADAALWSAATAEYSADADLHAYTVEYDTGATAAWRFDVDDDQEWARVLEEYDAQGRLFHQAALLDDESAWERVIDVADAEPWAYYIENYQDGGLQNATYYNADGTIFA